MGSLASELSLKVVSVLICLGRSSVIFSDSYDVLGLEIRIVVGCICCCEKQ